MGRLSVTSHSGYKSRSFRNDRIKLNFLGQAAASGCEDFVTFRELTLYESGCLSPKILRKMLSSGLINNLSRRAALRSDVTGCYPRSYPFHDSIELSLLRRGLFLN